MKNKLSVNKMIRNIFINLPQLIEIIILLTITITFTERSSAMDVNNVPCENCLYRYSSWEISNFLKNIGYRDYWENEMRISRNSDGTALRFLNREKKKVLIVKCDGSIDVKDVPSNMTWLNDANEPIMWLTYPDNKVIVNYANGTSETLPFSPQGQGPDNSGKYFIKSSDEKPSYVTIYSTEKPNVPLVKVNIWGAQLLRVKDKKIYLAGLRYTTGVKYVFEVRIFKEKEHVLEQVDDFIVPLPYKPPKYEESGSYTYYMFRPVDMSPWKEEILYEHWSDFPSRSVYYTYNLKTKQWNEVGKGSFWGEYPFYLKCDILKNVEQKKKK